MKLGVVILAAGQGTRMHSKLPKVLHRLAGQSLLGRVIDTAKLLHPARIVVVYGHGGDTVKNAFDDESLIWVEQAQQLGTGHAVQQAIPALAGMDRVLIVYGDVPLVSDVTLGKMLSVEQGSDLTLLTVNLGDPHGYGRILRDGGNQITAIVEQKDATPDQLQISEINTGILAAAFQPLCDWLEQISNDNAQQEFYLTDIVELAVSAGVQVQAIQPVDEQEVMGVNDRVQLAVLERYFQQQQAERLMRNGLTLRDPARFDLRGTLQCGVDVVIDINVVLEGDVSLGDEVSIGPNCLIRNSEIGAGVQIHANSVIDQAVVGDDCRIGPFARLRPAAKLADHVHVGNFVEIKKSDIGASSKISHLSYIGDTTMGERVNIGAGTITCNYDGVNKHRTEIGDDVFIGSDTQLVAPVKVGRGATIGAGSTITIDAPEDQLSLCRATSQRSIRGWKRPLKSSE